MTSRRSVTRRRFLQASLLSGAGTFGLALSRPILAREAGSNEGFCVVLCNHWSYIGIGWQLGIESSVLSATDAMEMADRAPHVKTCLNLDARAYEVMAEKFPEITERLKQYLADGKVELIGGTYGQPMGTTFSGESNIRQLVYGRETIRKALNYEMATFLEEEEFTHPQVPQIAVGAGYRYASLAQVDTWGNAGIPRLEVNDFNWKGKDGTAIPSTPKNSLFGYSPDLKTLVASEGFRKLQKLGKPLVFTWEEFGWEPPEEPAYLKTPEKYRRIAEESPVEFVTLKQYMDKYGANPKETIYLEMDAWNKLLTWGLGGDQLRILDRKVEGLLLAAERFDAIAATMGALPSARDLDQAWRNLLASQSHDVGLCEYSRWQGDRMAPLDRIEDRHNFTWGAIGYNHLDAAERQGRAVLDRATAHIVGQTSPGPGKRDQLTVYVFNPCAWERDDVALTGRIYPIQGEAKDIVVRHHSGRVVPSQIIKSYEDGAGKLVVGDVAFLAEKVPSVGYDTYYLELSPEVAKPAETDLHINEEQLELENKFVRIKLGATHGALVSLIDKQTGREMLEPAKSAFPVFKGAPNQDYCLRSLFIRMKHGRPELAIPPLFDSSKSVGHEVASGKQPPSSAPADQGAIPRSEIHWVEKGPLRATVQARHDWPLLRFETDVTLCAGLPRVEVTSRVLSEIPPAPDALDANGRFPIEIKEGYWLTFAPGFQPVSIVRDFPLAIEPTERQAFQALTFVDLVGKDTGLLVLHAGTQYFKRDSHGIFANLLMREWESHWTGEYGWPRYAEYHHALLPHRGDLTNADRLRAAGGFTQKLIAVLGQAPRRDVALRKGFVTLSPNNVQILAFRKKDGPGSELRVVEVEGRKSDASVELALPVARCSETDLLGNRVADVAWDGSRLNFEIQPWRVRTFEII